MFEELLSGVAGFSPYLTPSPNPNSPHANASMSHSLDGLGAQPAFELDKAAASQSEIISQTTDSTTNDHKQSDAIVTQHVANDAIVTTRQPESIRTMKCELCNVICNDSVTFERHKQGKKHLKNTQKLAISSVITPKMPELEDKKHKLLQNGATVDTLLYCETCNVICNDQNVFQNHLAGKKHSEKAVMSTDIAVNATSDAGPDPLRCKLCELRCTSILDLNIHMSGQKHLKKVKELGKIPDPSLTILPTKNVQNSESSEGKDVNSSEGHPVSCELCGISDLLKFHLLGKKHQKNLEKSQKLVGPSIAPMPMPRVLQNEGTEEGKDVNSHDGEKVSCELCRISCDSYDVLKMHLLGKKHKKNLEKSEKLIGPTFAPKTTPVVLQNEVTEEGKDVNSHEGEKVSCELCGISCDSYDVLKMHLLGKKHQKNLEKSKKVIGPNPVPGVLKNEGMEEGKVVNLDGGSRKTKRVGGDEDIEAKRRKVLESGGTLDALRTCTVCNVVCGSATVYIQHLAGKKHAAMAVKQAESQTGLTGQPT